jgi:hypothetical protein
MKIEAQPTTSTMAEAVEAKAEAALVKQLNQLLMEDIGILRQTIEMARQCIDADDVIGAHQILTKVLGEKE